MNRVVISLNGREYKAKAGMSLADIFGPARLRNEGIIAASLDNHLVDLDTKIRDQVELQPVFMNESDGRAVMKRSVAHMLHTIFSDRFKNLLFRVGQALLDGYYYEVATRDGSKVDLQALARSLTSGMKALARIDLKFEHRPVTLEEALAILTDPKKIRLLEAWTLPLVPLVRLGQFTDILHGPYAPTTGCARGARVIPWPPGILLQFPGAIEAKPTARLKKVWQYHREQESWYRRLDIETLADLNDAVLEGRLKELVTAAEMVHEQKISAIAEIISRYREIRVICIAGPLAAGKKSFLRRLAIRLEENGIRRLILNLDDYFRDRTEWSEECTPNLTTPDSLNIALLDQQVTELLAGHPIQLPRFDLNKGVGAISNREPIRLGENELVILEGVHALHPHITNLLPAGKICKIFVNALTQLPLDAHNRTPSSDTRYLRRIIRDRLFRNISVEETITQWELARRLERKYILPLQQEADVLFNSALVYEPTVVKSLATRFLLEVPRRHASRRQARRLLRFLNFPVPVLPDVVPAQSILREYIG